MATGNNQELLCDLRESSVLSVFHWYQPASINQHQHPA